MGEDGPVAEVIGVTWTAPRQGDALRHPEPGTVPGPPAAGNWPALPGRWPLSRSVPDDWLRLDLARLDAEQRLV
jgi:hypothetical protein